MIGFDILFLGGITLVAYCVAAELWQDPRLCSAFSVPCRQRVRQLFSSNSADDNVKPGLLGFTALLFGAALIGMVINLTADKVLDKEEWLARFPPGCWHDEDYWKLQAVKEAVTLAAEPKVTHIIRNHSDNVHSAKSFIQHAYPEVQKQQNSNVLTGLRYEFLVVKVLRVFLLLVVGLYVLMILRAGWVLIEKRKFRDRWVGLVLTTILAFCLYGLLMWLWTQQSRRYYKKLVHAYIVLAAPEDKSLLATSLESGWAAKAWDNVNDDSHSLIITKPVEHFGACDGSNGISTGPRHFVAASDDNNIILLFETDGAKSKPLLDLNSWLGFSPHNGKFRESDLEGAARIGDRIFWIGSHGRNNEGEERKERQVFFATAVTGSGENTGLQPVGQPYKELLRDLLSQSSLQALSLAEAVKKAPKEAGALNIESMCALGQSLYIGFRNPIPGGKALVLPMINPTEVVEKAAPARFGDPILLDLGGLGIRDMVWWRDAFLIVGGDYRMASESGAKAPKLFLWEGTDKQPRALQVKLGDLNPEAAILFEDGDSGKLLLLSDDGNQKVGAGKMKDLEPSARWFRSVWIEKPH